LAANGRSYGGQLLITALPTRNQDYAGWRRVELCDIVSDTDESQSCALRQPARRCQAAYPLIRISPFDTSTVPGAQTWIGFSHEYSGWLVVSVTFSRS